MAEPGAVAWQFERKGIVLVAKQAAGRPLTEDDLMLVGPRGRRRGHRPTQATAGRSPTAPDRPRRRARPPSRRPGIAVDSAELTMVPTTTVPLEQRVRRHARCCASIDLLEDLDDVQNVYANFDIPDSILELVEA